MMVGHAIVKTTRASFSFVNFGPLLHEAIVKASTVQSQYRQY
jgi:hypothetical protein